MTRMSKADEAAMKYVEEWTKKQEFGFINHRTLEMRQDFRAGFEQGYAVAQAEAEKLIRALESRDHEPYGAHDKVTCDACIAIDQYRKSLEGE